MKILIETPRLQMREFCLEDTDAVFEFGSNPEVAKYTGDKVTKTKEDARKIITDIWLPEYKKYGYARYALIHKADDKLIGFCGLKYEPRLEGPDIGYRMLPEYWGKGLGTEAAKATLEYAVQTLGLKKIFGEAVAENVASCRILEKLGFVFEKTYKMEGFVINQYLWRKFSG